MSENLPENSNLENDDLQLIEEDELINENQASVLKQQMKESLKRLDLTPDQTRDEPSAESIRDNDLLGDVPPHHGTY